MKVILETRDTHSLDI